MKKLTLITTIILTANILFAQSIQIDLPGNEIPLKEIKPDSKSTFLKQPYLIFEGINTQMKILWQLEESATCEIFWGIDSTYSLGNYNTIEYGDDHQHAYTISGLNPGTKYHYKVEYDDAIHEASFKTAPEETATDLKFFVYGDTRSDVDWHDLNSQAIITEYTADPEFQTFTLFTGDHVTYGAAESSWQSSFFSPNALNIRKRMAEVPFVSCLGNHELYYDNYDSLDYNTELYGKYFPYPYVDRRYWSFDYGPMHVTVLDQYPDYYVILPPIGYLDVDEMAWIEEDLSNTDKPWKIIIMHEPGWSCEGSSSGFSHPNNEDVQNLLQPLCEEYGVQIVFSAHNHYYARACKNGVFHVTTAGGGAPLYEVEEDFDNVIHTKKVHHYCKVEIEGETMSVTAITPYGEVIDEFVVDQEDRPNHLLGFLTKETGLGLIDDVTISASGQTTSADETGYYGLELVPGYHEASFMLEGYCSISETVELSEGTETQFDTMMVICTVVENNLDSDKLIISPNPVSNKAILSYHFPYKGNINVCIFNTTGIQLKQWQFHNQQPGNKEYSLDLRDLPGGVYFCRLQVGNDVVTKKIIKTR